MDEASNESMRILNGDIGGRSPSTSTSKKPLSRDTDDARELYALDVSETQTSKDRGILGRGEVNIDSSES